MMYWTRGVRKADEERSEQKWHSLRQPTLVEHDQHRDDNTRGYADAGVPVMTGGELLNFE